MTPCRIAWDNAAHAYTMNKRWETRPNVSSFAVPSLQSRPHHREHRGFDRLVYLRPCIHDELKVIRHKLEAMSSFAVPPLHRVLDDLQDLAFDVLGQTVPRRVDGYLDGVIRVCALSLRCQG
jgi:hypothetical protein